MKHRKGYDHIRIERKWQKAWESKKLFRATTSSTKPKWYSLIEFPYPSGDGLHVGHIRSNTAMDIISHKRRREGFEVLYPIGWDAFGLPTENFAIKTGIHPTVVTKKNTETFRTQLKSLGFSFDWSREINTTDPTYYRWTQWIFLQFYKKGLAYKHKTTINWCPKDKVGLANEEVVDGCCERCGTPVEKREKEQWMLAITKYADRLIDDLDTVDYLPEIKSQQKHWIGRSEGAEFDFAVTDLGVSGVKSITEKITVFTTRADTLFGVTYIVLAPEHPLVEKLKARISNAPEVTAYVAATRVKTDIDRTNIDKEKTGVPLTGITVTNPATGAAVPVWIADYVLADYGTGAVMAVPAHDDRDFAFATKYTLPITEVIIPRTVDTHDPPHAYTEYGILQHSGDCSGMQSHEALPVIAKKYGRPTTSYKLRDWVFSRQRYWGEPIPMVHCATCGWQPVPEKELPIKLPTIKKYQPTDTGESPLATETKWLKAKCPQCNGVARRETDTMPNWAGSSWYYLRYTDPKNKKMLADPKALAYWTPVDWYNGGMEHTTLHLLYSRFWHKFLFDIGVVPTIEPYKKRTAHGLILAEDGRKMSKSWGNVVNPDSIVSVVGADSLRLYQMFMGPFDQAIAWNSGAISGSRRFIERVWNLGVHVTGTTQSAERRTLMHQTIKKVTDDIESMRFNTAVSSLMIFANALEKGETTAQEYEILLALLAPFIPHVTEELWSERGHKTSIHRQSWPTYDAQFLLADTVTIAVQINGKTRGTLQLPRGSDEKTITTAAHAVPGVAKWLHGNQPKKTIIVPNKLINFVIDVTVDL